MPACCQASNRRERRKHRERRKYQGFKLQRIVSLTAEEKAQHISAIIDENIVGIEYRGWHDWPGWWLLRQYKLYTVGENQSDIIQELEKIDVYIQQLQDPKVLPILAEKDAIVKGLINSLTSSKNYFDSSGWPNIKGSMIDVLYEETRFSNLSPQLRRYIGNKIKDQILGKYISLYGQWARVRPHYQKKTSLCLHADAACISLITESAIHSIALEGFEYPIDKTSIEMSRDKKYIRAKDMVAGHTLVWDMMTGERCNADSCQLKNKVWVKKELYKTKDLFAEFEFYIDEQYHVSACGSKGFFGCNEAETPTLFLYKKPTFYSWLCQIVLSNYVCNNDELDALLQSNMLNSLEGFVKDNFKRAIELAKKENGYPDATYCLN
jgi:hypothetical protein